MIKKYNISKPEKYTDKNGNEKTYWNNVGTITEFIKENGNVSKILEIPAIGLKAQIFENKPKENKDIYPRENEGSIDKVDTLDIEKEDSTDEIPF